MCVRKLILLGLLPYMVLLLGAAFAHTCGGHGDGLHERLHTCPACVWLGLQSGLDSSGPSYAHTEILRDGPLVTQDWPYPVDLPHGEEPRAPPYSYSS